MKLWKKIKESVIKAYNYVKDNYQLASSKAGEIKIVNKNDPNKSLSLDTANKSISLDTVIDGTSVSAGYGFANSDISGKITTQKGDTYSTNFSLPKEYFNFSETIVAGPLAGYSSSQDINLALKRAKLKANYVGGYTLETVLSDPVTLPRKIPANVAKVYAMPKFTARASFLPRFIESIYARVPIGKAAYARPVGALAFA